jgi:hypothetical protein
MLFRCSNRVSKKGCAVSGEKGYAVRARRGILQKWLPNRVKKAPHPFPAKRDFLFNLGRGARPLTIRLWGNGQWKGNHLRLISGPRVSHKALKKSHSSSSRACLASCVAVLVTGKPAVATFVFQALALAVDSLPPGTA